MKSNYRTILILFFIFLLNVTQDSLSAAEQQCCKMTNTYGMHWDSPGECKAVLLCIHGLGLCARGYEGLGQQLCRKGITTFAIDVRGFGPHRHDNGYSKLDLNGTVRDLQKILEELSERYPKTDIYILGESLGGSIAINFAAENPAHLNGIICSAPAWKIYKEKRTIIKALVSWLSGSKERLSIASSAIMHQATTKKELYEHWRTDKSHRLSLSPLEAVRLVRFMGHTPKNAKKIDNMPVLIVQGLKDKLVKINGAAKLFSKIPSKDKELLLVADAEHLIFEEGQCTSLVANTLADWILAESKNNYSANQAGLLLTSNDYSKKTTKLFQRAGITNVIILSSQNVHL